MDSPTAGPLGLRFTATNPSYVTMRDVEPRCGYASIDARDVTFENVQFVIRKGDIPPLEERTFRCDIGPGGVDSFGDVQDAAGGLPRSANLEIVVSYRMPLLPFTLTTKRTFRLVPDREGKNPRWQRGKELGFD